MASADQILIDGLDVNDQVDWSLLAGSVTFTPAKKKLNWATSPLADGSALVGDDSHYENAEFVFTVRAKQQASKDAALGLWNALTDKLQEARRRPGEVTLVWVLADSSAALTYYIHDAEYDEIHTSKEGGWFDNMPELVVHLYLRPFGYAAEQQAQMGYSDSFNWDGITGGRWRFGTGSGTLDVDTGAGALVPNSTATKIIYLPFTTENATVVTRVAIGATVSGGAVGGVLRYQSTSTYLGGRINATSLQIHRGASSLATTSFTPSASTTYWLSFSVDGDDVNLAVYSGSQNPLTTANATSLADVSYDLAGGALGAGSVGNCGLQLTPAGTSSQWFISDFYLRGMESIQSAEPLVAFEVSNVRGHVPAEGRLSVTEGGGNSQGHFEFGEETRDYVVGTPLILDSRVLTAGSSTRVSGTNKYNPTSAATNDAIQSQPLGKNAAVQVCGTNVQAHVGTYKVKARVKGTAGVRVRLAWQAGLTPFVHNDYAPALSGVEQEVDLGMISVPEQVLGNHFWLGKVEAYSPVTAGGNVQVDYLLLIPQERYGVAKAPLTPVVADSYSVLDNFLQASGALNTKSLEVPSGQTWATAGALVDGTHPDFTVVDASDNVTRTSLSDDDLNSGRYALAGSTSYTAVQAQVTVTPASNQDASLVANTSRLGVILRYVDTSNWFLVALQNYLVGASERMRLRVYKRVAGTVTQLASKDLSTSVNASLKVVAAVDASGLWQAYAFEASTNQPGTPALSGQDAVLVTGAALATGKVGIYDALNVPTARTRTFDSFAAFTSIPDVVMNPSQGLEVRSDIAARQSSTGTVWGKVPQYRGERFLVPAEGDNQYVTRIAAKARRLNVDEGLTDAGATPLTTYSLDPMTLSVFVSPRYLHPTGQNFAG